MVAPTLDEAIRLAARLAHCASLSIAVERNKRRSLGHAPVAGAHLVHQARIASANTSSLVTTTTSKATLSPHAVGRQGRTSL